MFAKAAKWTSTVKEAEISERDNSLKFMLKTNQRQRLFAKSANWLKIHVFKNRAII